MLDKLVDHKTNHGRSHTTLNRQYITAKYPFIFFVTVKVSFFFCGRPIGRFGYSTDDMQIQACRRLMGGGASTVWCDATTAVHGNTNRVHKKHQHRHFLGGGGSINDASQLLIVTERPKHSGEHLVTYYSTVRESRP